MADALARALRADFGFDVAGKPVTTGQELVSAAGRIKPDCSIVDWWLPEMEASAATRLIVRQVPACKIIFTSWLFGVRDIQAGLQAGAVGFLPKNISVARMAEGIHRALAGEAPVFEEELDGLLRKIDDQAFKADQAWERLSELTAREIQTLRLLDEGLLIEDVARHLKIKPATVRHHIHNVLAKTGTQTQTQAIAKARHHGLIRS